MKIQILAPDGKLLETIDKAHEYLKSQHRMTELMDILLNTYRKKYSVYMWEQYQQDRRESPERRTGEERRSFQEDRRSGEDRRQDDD
jgi:hypothetical protein